jgi:hypothetical protein
LKNIRASKECPETKHYAEGKPGPDFLGEESLRALRNDQPSTKEGLEDCRRACGSAATPKPFQIERSLNLSHQLPSRDWVPGKRPEASWENALKAL